MATLVGSGTILMPGGTYRTTSETGVGQSAAVIEGRGRGQTIIAPAHPVGDVISVGRSTYSANVTLRSLSIISPWRVGGGSIANYNSSDLTLDEIEVNGGCHGLLLNNGGLQAVVKVSASLIQWMGGDGIDIGAASTPPAEPNEIHLTDVTIALVRGAGLGLFYADGLYAKGVSVYQAGVAGLLAAPGATQVVSDLKFVECFFDSTALGDGVTFAGSGTIGTTVFGACSSNSNYGCGWNVGTGPRVNGAQWIGGQLTNNRLAGALLANTTVNDSAGGHKLNLLIQGVLIALNSQASVGGTSGVVVQPGVSGWAVKDCAIGGVGHLANVLANRQAYAVQVASGASDDYQVTGNRFVGNLSGGLLDGGTGTNKAVTPNLVS